MAPNHSPTVAVWAGNKLGYCQMGHEHATEKIMNIKDSASSSTRGILDLRQTSRHLGLRSGILVGQGHASSLRAVGVAPFLWTIRSRPRCVLCSTPHARIAYERPSGNDTYYGYWEPGIPLRGAYLGQAQPRATGIVEVLTTLTGFGPMSGDTLTARDCWSDGGSSPPYRTRGDVGRARTPRTLFHVLY